MISHDDRFLFIHVPKTGGSSITELIIDRVISLPPELYPDSIYRRHVPASDVLRALGSQFFTYYRFAVVRNPWDWVVSNYLFIRGLHKPYMHATQYEGVEPWIEKMTFPDWVRWWFHALRPTQVGMLVDDEGRNVMDDVFRTEDLDAAIPVLRERLGMRKLPDMPRRNMTKRRADYRTYYDDDTADLVARHMAREIEEYGYGFDDYDLWSASRRSIRDTADPTDLVVGHGEGELSAT